MNKSMKIGLNIFSECVENELDSYTLPVKAGKGIDFAVCHFSPKEKTMTENVQTVDKVAGRLEAEGIELVANFEYQNWSVQAIAPDGVSWLDDSDSGHRLAMHEPYLKAFNKYKCFIGLMYDEFEHVIINQNLSLALESKGKVKRPVFPLSEGDTTAQARLLENQITDYREMILKKGARLLVGEHVFPVLFHLFARVGMIPNFKSQKESYSNIQFACAAGAAIQYKMPLWNCVDLWFRNTFPGHSPEEMYNNLVFAYLAGVDRVYVEAAIKLVENGDLSAHGAAFARFSNEYRGKNREYNVQDYRPEIGIIKFDDGFWGQRDPWMWRPMLLGNHRLKPDKGSKEWIKAMHTVVHGETSKYGLTWSKISPWSIRRHRSFASMNSAVVFDENVRAEHLQSLKLCFLCGNSISEKTLEDVAKCVRENGLTVVTTKRLLPCGLAKKHEKELRDGKGTWIVTKSFCSGRLKKRLAPFLGKKGEIRLTFSDREIKLRISKNGDAFTQE